MRNVAFTPKGDHIAWTQVPVNPLVLVSLFFSEVWYFFILGAST